MATANDPWRQEAKRLLTQAASAVDDFVDVRWRKLRRRLGREGKPQVQPYLGYANEHHAWLHGRVLTNPPAPLAEGDQPWQERLAASYQRLASDEVPGVRLRVRLGEQDHEATSDAEGYFHLHVEHGFRDHGMDPWVSATVQIIDHPRVTPEESAATCDVLRPPADASLAVVSDVDDTIMHTGATRLVTMMRLTMLGTARTRQPLAGAAAFYRALERGPNGGEAPEQNPVFYVSSSPWNLFDLLEDFIELNDLPRGPILLRDLGFDSNKLLAEGHDHKLDKTRRLLDTYPNLPFVLIGDSGQEDARLYATAAEEYGDRIRAIFIRDIDPDIDSKYDATTTDRIERARAVGVPMHLVRDSTEAAKIAQTLGLIDPKAIPAIEAATKADEQLVG